MNMFTNLLAVRQCQILVIETYIIFILRRNVRKLRKCSD